MTDDPVHQGRRRFLNNFFQDAVVEPVAQSREEERELLERELCESAYEIGLRAYGPDLLAGTAKSLGVTVEDGDYRAIAKVLADENLKGGDQGEGKGEDGQRGRKSEGGDEQPV